MNSFLSELRSDLWNFASHLDTLNDFNNNDFNVLDNFWSLAEVPILPISFFDLETGARRGLSVHDFQNTPGDDAYVYMVFAVSPSGAKTAPMFLIRKPFLRGQWFFPLDEEIYRNGYSIREFFFYILVMDSEKRRCTLFE